MSFTAAADQPTARVRLLTSADSGASFQVRGLRGNAALAQWLEQHLQGGTRRCRASAASGVVRLHGAPHAAARIGNRAAACSANRAPARSADRTAVRSATAQAPDDRAR
jgi:hypothetical protein